jgi:hypothetical protein
MKRSPRRYAAPARGRRRLGRASGAGVLLVNMIPRALSGEENQDSEPTIAVNPANPLLIAGSAFTPDPAGGSRAPIYVSTDGGRSWTLNAVVPGADPDTGTHDITLQFGSRSNVLYAGILRGDTPGTGTRMDILRTRDFRSPTPMQILTTRPGIDQPYVQAITTADGHGQTSDRLYVGDNDFRASGGRTATIDQSLNAARPTPTFRSVRLESRATPGQDGPPVRPAIHPDGTLYAVFHAWRTYDDASERGTADVVVLRDDHGGAGPTAFADLVDPADARPGIAVARNARFDFGGFLGLQRTGGDVAIAVDPRNSDVVYVAYNDDRGATYTLHLLRSTTRGRTWEPELRTMSRALNPALAVNQAGALGLLYQQLTGAGAAQRWVTKLELRDDTGRRTLVLARVPARIPSKVFDPYLGDYAHLMSVGGDFYGVFSTGNTPRRANFPLGVVYQRNADWTSGTLLGIDGTTPVSPSIDPFFFRIAG